MSMKEDLVEVIKALVLPEIAEIKQGLAEVRAELKVTNSRLDLLDERYDDLRDQMNLRFEQVDKRFDEMKSDTRQRFDLWEKRFDEIKTDTRQHFELWEKRFDELGADMRAGYTALANGQESLRRDIAEIRSYVWTSGLDARQQEQFKLVREKSERPYKTGKK